MSTDKRYSLADVMKTTGAKRSQVEYWTRVGVLVPAVQSDGTGVPRQFDFANLVQVALMLKLGVVLSAPTLSFVLGQLAAAGMWRELAQATFRRKRPVLRIWFGTGAEPEPYVGPASVVAARIAEVSDDAAISVIVDLDALLAALEECTGDSL